MSRKISLKFLDDLTWDKFVKESLNGCFYDESSFLNYYRGKVSQVKKIAFLAGQELIAVLPVGINANRELVSPFSASFGGFVFQRNLHLEEVLSIFESLIDWAKKSKIKKIAIREKPIIYYQEPSDIIAWAYHNFGFNAKITDLTMYLRLRRDFLENCSKTARNLIRRGEKEGFCFFESDNLDDVFFLIEESSRKKGHGLSLTYQELTDLKKLFPDKIKFYGLKLQKDIIAASIVYFLNKTTALVMFWAYDKKWEKLSPTYFLIDQIVKACYKNKFSYLDFGNVTINSKPYWGVVDFKEKFNPSGAVKKIYQKNL